MKNGYIRLTMPDGSRVYEHRQVWEDAHGPIPDGAHIHHIDGDPTNNGLDNLAVVATDAEHDQAHGGSRRWKGSTGLSTRPKSVYMREWRARKAATV
jgi:hypothetical protein